MFEDGFKINPQQQALYIKKGYWKDESLLDCWQRSVNKYPNREYVVDDRGFRYTYKQLDTAAAKVAAFLLEKGIGHQDVVSFQLPVWSEFVILTIACYKVGAIAHPIAMCYEEKELIRSLNITESKIYFGVTYFHKTDYEKRITVAKADIPNLKNIIMLDYCKEKSENYITLNEILASYSPLAYTVPCCGQDLAVLLCTSGTTGGTKGVLLTHNNVRFSEEMFNKELALTDDDIMFMPAPLDHATGFHHGIIAPMLRGGKVVLQQKYICKEAITIMNREKCTYSMGATPFIYDIIKELETTGQRLPYLKFYLCGGAPVPGAMVQRAWNIGILLCEVYGSTESVPHAFVRPSEALKLNGASSGRTIEGVEIKVVDDNGNEVLPGTPGEEISRGPNIFAGYLKAKDITDNVIDSEGWFHSGDLCVMDKQGNIKIIGRKKDMIVRGGENLNSNEIDEKLEGCPGIKARAVIGMPDERLGERICLFAVLENKNNGVCLEAIRKYLFENRVPKRFWPERLEIIDKIPLTSSGKIKKYILQEELKKRMEAEV